ncbi:hypothetical protein [Microbacterium phyllosphaerae]
MAARRANPAQVREELRLATRLAVLCSPEVLVPAASYFESELCAETIDELADLFPLGGIRLVGGDNTVEDFMRAKLESYDEGGPQHSSYLSSLSGHAVFPPFNRRARSATSDIRAAWNDRASAPGFLDYYFGEHASLLPAGFVTQWHEVPDQLGKRAFTPAYASTHLASGTIGPIVESTVTAFINAEYFRSYSDEYGAGFVSDLALLGAGIELDDRFGNISYRIAVRGLHERGLLERVRKATAQELLALKNDETVILALLPSIAATSGGSQSRTAAQLSVPPTDQTHAVATLRGTKTGREAASTYQRRVGAILDQVLSHSLSRGNVELPINDGRKRIDLAWINHAESGFFRWLTVHGHMSSMVFAECKNYRDDPQNPELDQLIGRFNPRVSRFGLLLCRKVKDRDLVTRRCRDAFQAGQGLILVLDDDDIAAIAGSASGSAWEQPHSTFLWRRAQQVVL